MVLKECSRYLRICPQISHLEVVHWLSTIEVDWWWISGVAKPVQAYPGKKTHAAY